MPLPRRLNPFHKGTHLKTLFTNSPRPRYGAVLWSFWSPQQLRQPRRKRPPSLRLARALRLEPRSGSSRAYSCTSGTSAPLKAYCRALQSSARPVSINRQSSSNFNNLSLGWTKADRQPLGTGRDIHFRAVERSARTRGERRRRRSDGPAVDHLASVIVQLRVNGRDGM